MTPFERIVRVIGTGNSFCFGLIESKESIDLTYLYCKNIGFLYFGGSRWHAYLVTSSPACHNTTSCAEADFDFYLEKLKHTCAKHGCAVHAYLLMTNHVHLLITPQGENILSKIMQMVGRDYLQYFNYCYRRNGTLFEGRYKATLVDSESYLLTCMR
jgi:REP element-mobilizing transposase RayT